jgi:hypothetical protein
MAQLLQRLQFWVPFGDIPERVLVELKPAGSSAGPADLMLSEPRLEPVSLERGTLVHAVALVDLSRQLRLDRLPAITDLAEQGRVDRHPGVLHAGRGFHVPTAQKGLPEALPPRADGREHPLYQRAEAVNV